MNVRSSCIAGQLKKLLSINLYDTLQKIVPQQGMFKLLGVEQHFIKLTFLKPG